MTPTARALQSLRAQIDDLRQNLPRVRPGVNTRIDIQGNVYTVHNDSRNVGGGLSYDVPWLFAVDTMQVNDPNAQEDPETGEHPQITVPSLKINAASKIFDLAGEREGPAEFYLVGYRPDADGNRYAPLQLEEGEYYIGLSLHYGASTPMKLKDYAQPMLWYDFNEDGVIYEDGHKPYQAKIDIYPTDEFPLVVVQGEDENAWLQEHTIIMGKIIQDPAPDPEPADPDNPDPDPDPDDPPALPPPRVISYRPGHQLSLWPIAIAGLPASHPLQ